MTDDEHAAPEREAPGTGAPEGAWEPTRREFLACSTTAVVAAALPLEAEGAPRPAPRIGGPGPVELVLRVNGKRRRVEVEPGTSLAAALREQLGHTGTKVGCNRGSCSACTVLLDGVPVSACMTLALDVGDREVTTIEGLATATGLNPVQQAFVAHDAMQCGFCTPGMVMSCVALLARNPSPTLDDVKTATSGNLCRCGSYPKVFEAVLAVTGGTARR
jgi:aerobic-type carbon monoxide dehydrogenase small subunit (CoxS/CutS family)